MDPKPDKFIPALYGGVIMALVSSIPFLNLINCFCCAGIMLGGFLAVFFYKSNFTPGTPPFTSGDCMGVGALAGFVGAVGTTILTGLFLFLFGNVMEEFIVNMLHDLNVDLPDEAWRAIEESLSGGFRFVALIWKFFTNLFTDVVFGLLGGLIGYSAFKPKPAVMPPPPPVQQA